MARIQQQRLAYAKLPNPCTRQCEHSYSVVNEVTKWNCLIRNHLCRRQVATASTGCCGFNGIKQCLGITDIKQLIVDIRRQILLEMETLDNGDDDSQLGMSELARVNAALGQVDSTHINMSGWFTDFLAEYAAKAYGVSILIIRRSGIFTFFQVRC